MPIAAPMVARSVQVSDDVRLEYVERGAADGLPVVMLHGVTDSWGSFEGVMAHLPESLRAIAVSQRGHGNSSRPASGYRMADFSRDLTGFLDALDIPSAVVAGHSMGSFVGQRFAMDHPDRTLGLVLMGSGAQMSGNPVLREIRDEALEQSDPVDPGFVREFQAGTLARSVAPSLFHAAVAESLKVPARVWHETFSGILEVDHRADLSRITAPTMIVWGNCDTVFVESDQAALRDGIAGARMVIYRGGGHGFHWEDAATFAADLVTFCDTIRR